MLAELALSRSTLRRRSQQKCKILWQRRPRLRRIGPVKYVRSRSRSPRNRPPRPFEAPIQCHLAHSLLTEFHGGTLGTVQRVRAVACVLAEMLDRSAVVSMRRAHRIPFVGRAWRRNFSIRSNVTSPSAAASRPAGWSTNCCVNNNKSRPSSDSHSFTINYSGTISLSGTMRRNHHSRAMLPAPSAVWIGPANSAN